MSCILGTAATLGTYGALQTVYTKMGDPYIPPIRNNTIAGSLAGFTTVFGIGVWEDKPPVRQISKAVIKDMLVRNGPYAIKYGVLSGGILGFFIGLNRDLNKSKELNR
jgi:hypothetical protein